MHQRARMVVTWVVLSITLLPLPTTAQNTSQPDAGLTTLSGRFEMVWGDPRPGSDAAPDGQAVLIGRDGRSTRLDLLSEAADAFGGPLALSHRDIVAAGTRTRSGALRVETMLLSPRPGPSAGSDVRPPVLGHKRWLNILCRFGDMPDVTPSSPEYVQSLMGGAEPQIDHYWREVSEGLIDVAGATVYGWYTMPQPRSYYITEDESGSYIDYSHIVEDCTGMADAEVDFNEYDGMNLLFNGELDGYARGGSYYIARDGVNRSLGVTWLPPWGYQTQYITGHEMGHAFGLPHSSGPYDATYDSDWDVMSLGGTCNPYDATYGCVGVHTIAFHKDWLGWIPAERKYLAASPSDQTITIERSALPTDAGQYLIAQIPIQGSTTRFYTVEARRFVGYDRRVPFEAIVIHHVDTRRFDRQAQVVDPDGNFNPNDDGAAWTPGETFTDGANDISVSVQSATPTGFVVTIHASDAYGRTWARTDQPVAGQQVSRTWMWGPAPFTDIVQESYLEAGVGPRNVRYYDKSRMEITYPDDDPNSVWYVTNGLLVVELTTGRMQFGDNSFDQREPAQVNVAGDADDSTGPAYATFGMLRDAPPLPDGAAVIQRLDRAGQVVDDPALAGRGVVAAHRVMVPTIDHQVASPFWDFMNSDGLVYQAGGYSNAPLFQDPFYATGLPISEAYWATVKVAGTYRDVLMQCFERRCLTYTPDNPEGWQVEAGNVGQHYYAWRYSIPDFAGRIAFASDRYGDGDILAIDGVTKQTVPLNLDPTWTDEAEWSPDGTQIAFTSYVDGFSNIYVADAAGQNVVQVSHDIDARNPAWSPDGTKFAFSGSTPDGTDIYLVDVDGNNLTPLTGDFDVDAYPDWSPDGTKIVYSHEIGNDLDLWMMSADGTNPTPLTSGPGYDNDPAWSPDGSRIVFERTQFDIDIWVVNADGSNPIQITSNPGWDSDPAWSPDGTRIAFISTRGGGQDIYLMDADGSHAINLLNTPYSEYHPTWTGP